MTVYRKETHVSVRTHTITRKGLALVTAGLFAVSSLSFAPIAGAEDPASGATGNTGGTNAGGNNGAGTVTPAMVSQLKSTDEAKLTIHKLKGGFVGTNQWGVEQNVAGTPLNGIAFDVYKVRDIDLSTIEGWKKYSQLDPTNVDQYATDANYVKTLTTANGGVASDTLPIGVYVVKENLSKSNPDPAGTYSPAAPFMTALPFTNEEGTGWNKDVHVYPKNQELKSTKTVTDQGKHAGQEITYDLKGDVPPIPGTVTGDYYTEYVLVDTYDSQKWTPKKDSVSVKVTGGAGLTFETKDFTVSGPADKPAGAPPELTGDKQITVSLTGDGLRKLEEYVRANSTVTGMQVVATVKGDLNATLTPGPLKNQLHLVSGGTGKPRTQTPDVETESKFGKISVTKVDSKDNDKQLAGATFELHKCENSNEVGKPGKLIADSKQTVNGADSWTSDANGALTITGIQLEDWYNGASQTDAFDYCLVETEAPAGYELLPEPVLVPVNQALPDSGTNAFTAAANVANVETTTATFKLPATGEWGRWWIVLGGVLAVLAALTVLYRNGRRNDA